MSEGMLRYIGVNTDEFESLDECCGVVARALDRAGWKPDYVRRLRADRLRFSAPTAYGHAGGLLEGSFLYLDIRNGRPDVAALEATARLAEFGRSGEPLRPSPIRSPLKATGRPGFSHTIFPNSHESFDLLCVGAYRTGLDRSMPAGTAAVEGPPIGFAPQGVYLNSAHDVIGEGRLPITPGAWLFRYEFYAIGFPLLSVLIELTVTYLTEPAATIVAQEIR
jgi:hypothetical protein